MGIYRDKSLFIGYTTTTMSNELLLLVSALTDICFVFIAARLGTKWIFGTIAVNLILISIFGAKLISIFGLITNAGNVFYACVFLATHFLLERRSQKQSMETIWFGSGFVIFFIILSQCAVHFVSTSPDAAVNNAIQSLFVLSPRIAIASLLAYIFAQYVNIVVYEWIKKRTSGNFLWLRSLVANMLGQLVDSCLFFTIAFLDLPGASLLQAIFAGWLIKTVVVLLGTPFLYIDTYRESKT